MREQEQAAYESGPWAVRDNADYHVLSHLERIEMDTINTADFRWHWDPDSTQRIKRIEIRPHQAHVVRGPTPREGLYRRVPIMPDLSDQLVNVNAPDPWGPTIQFREEVAHEWADTRWIALGVALDTVDNVRVEIGYYCVTTEWRWAETGAS